MEAKKTRDINYLNTLPSIPPGHGAVAIAGGAGLRRLQEELKAKQATALAKPKVRKDLGGKKGAGGELVTVWQDQTGWGVAQSIAVMLTSGALRVIMTVVPPKAGGVAQRNFDPSAIPVATGEKLVRILTVSSPLVVYFRIAPIRGDKSLPPTAVLPPLDIDSCPKAVALLERFAGTGQIKPMTLVKAALRDLDPANAELLFGPTGGNRSVKRLPPVVRGALGDLNDLVAGTTGRQDSPPYNKVMDPVSREAMVEYWAEVVAADAEAASAHLERLRAPKG